MTSQEYIQSFDEYRMQVFFFCKKIISQKEKAENITSEVFITLWHKRDKIKPEWVKSWLLTTARNKCFDYLRINKKTVA
jgi:RNA polymerase sigma factor (sigma-70 family)